MILGKKRGRGLTPRRQDAEVGRAETEDEEGAVVSAGPGQYIGALETEAEGADGWVMQCPASLGAGAPSGRDALRGVPILPVGGNRPVVPAGFL